MITINNLYKHFGDKTVLKNINTEFEDGKVNLIIGRSGSGKTVLLKCIIGLLQPTSGKVLFDNRDFHDFSNKIQNELKMEMGVVFQGSALFDYLTIEQNVMFPLDILTNKSMDEKLDRANYCLKRVGLENTNKLFPSELSGGMKKRAAIARAISSNPKYLFCDEPNSGLDPQTANLIDDLIMELTKEYEMTTVVVTHDMNSVLEIGEKVYFLYKGKIWWSGDRDTILHSDNKELNAFVFSSDLTRRLKPTKK